MTPTDELRARLDERGVEWKAPASYDGSTKYDTIVGDYWFHEYDGKITVHGLTPEQAIEATMGAGMCHDAAGEHMAFFACSACGATIERKHPRFCHGCGRKVVDE